MKSKKVFGLILSLLLLIPLQDILAQKASLIKLKTRGQKKIIYSHDTKTMAVASFREVLIMLAGGNSINSGYGIKLKEINDLCFSFDDQKLFVAGKKDFKNAIQILDFKAGTTTGSIPVESINIKSITSSPEGSYLAWCDYRGHVSVYDLKQSKVVYKFKSKHGIYTCVLFNLKGDRLFCSDSKGFINDINIIDGSILKDLNLAEGYIRTLELSNDGRYLACAFDNKICKLIEPDNGYAQHNLGGGQAYTYSLSFSEDNNYLLASSYGNIITLWSLEQMALKKRILANSARGTLTSARFDPACKVFYAVDFLSRYMMSFDISDLEIKPRSVLKNVKDKNPPQINLLSPSLTNNEATIYNEMLNLKGAAIDESGIYNLKINGNPVRFENDGSFDISLKIGMGENQFIIEATDVNELTAIKKFKIKRSNSADEVLEIDYNARNFLLVIGIDDYQHWPKLRNATYDAAAVKEVLLKKYNYKEENTVVVSNDQATKQGIIDAFKSIIEKIGPNDKLFIYFSGHGYFDNVLNEGYWIPQDAKKGTDADYLPNSYLVKLFKQISAKHVLVVADACFSGALFIDTQRGNLENASQSKSRWAITSGRLEYVDDGKEGEHSPFANSLLSYLTNNTKSRSSVVEMIAYIKEKVTAENKQVPVGNALLNAGDEGGEFIFDLFGN